MKNILLLQHSPMNVHRCINHSAVSTSVTKGKLVGMHPIPLEDDDALHSAADTVAVYPLLSVTV